MAIPLDSKQNTGITAYFIRGGEFVALCKLKVCFNYPQLTERPNKIKNHAKKDKKIFERSFSLTTK
jgi:hypothetical protein